MKKITDEMLNDYIDNQLDPSVLDEFKKELAGNEELLNKLKALKAVDNSLHKIEVIQAPESVTERVMNSVYKKTSSAKPKNNYFFSGIISLFVLSIGAVIASAWFLVEKESNVNQSPAVIESVKKAVAENIGVLKNFFDSNGVLLAGGVLTLILFISAVFVLDSHKNFKNKLKSFSH